MVRKITSIVTLIVVAFALLPAVAAFAATGSADVNAAHRNVFPSNGAQAALGITVRNTGAAANPLNPLGTAGDPIKEVIFDLPVWVDDVVCGTVQGWTCRAVNSTYQQSSIYWTATGNGILGGGSLSFPFTGKILAPESILRTQAVDVLVAGADRNYNYVSGNLDINIRGLELIQGVTITDERVGAGNAKRYTSGQTITADYDLLNRSGVAADVTPSFASTSFDGTLDSGNTNLGATDPAETYTFKVNTDGVASGEKIEDFNGTATGTIGGVTGDAVTIVGGGTQNYTRITGLEVEAPAGLTLGGVNTVEVNGENDRSVANENGTSISIAGTKANYPGVDLTTGADDSNLVLSIPGCVDPDPTDSADDYQDPVLAGYVGCEITVELSDVTGANGSPTHGVQLPRSGSLSSNLRFHYNNVNLKDLRPNDVADLVNVDATFTYSGTDDNAFDFPTISVTLEDLLTIDLAAPIMVLDSPVGNLLDGRAADGDTVTASGYVVHAGDYETSSVTLRASQQPSNYTLAANERVEIPEGSGNFFYSVTKTPALGGDTDCAGTPYEGLGLTCQSFSVEFDLPGDKNADDEDIYAIGKNGVLLNSGTATDDAGNGAPAIQATLPGGALAPLYVDVDNDHADVTPTRPVYDGGTLVDYEALAFYIYEPDFYGDQNVVRVGLDAGAFDDVLEGGCNPSRWNVDGVNVTEVLYSDGSTCVDDGTGRTFGPAPAYTTDNDRILVLDGEINPATNTVNFDYIADPSLLDQTLSPGAPITDDLANEAYAQSGRVLDLLTPLAPVLGNITRLDTFDGGRETVGESVDPDNGVTIHHSNVADLEIPITGFQPGADVLQVYSVDADGSLTPIGTEISTEGLDADSPVILDHTDIDFSDDDGAQVRSARAFGFIRITQSADSTGSPVTVRTAGPISYADFLYDSIPLHATMAQLELDGGDESGTDKVTFSFGGDADDANIIANFYTANAEWSGLRTVVGPGGSTPVVNDRARSVFNNSDNVTLDVNYRGAGQSDFHGGQHFQITAPSADAETIEDLAGNLMAPFYHIAKDGTLTLNPGQ